MGIEGSQACLGFDLGFCLPQDGQATKGGLRVCALSQRDGLRPELTLLCRLLDIAAISCLARRRLNELC